MVFFEDTLAARERNGGVFGEVSFNSLDPLVQIAALAGATSDIGLSASFSTTYHSPRVLADKLPAQAVLGWSMTCGWGGVMGSFLISGSLPLFASIMLRSPPPPPPPALFMSFGAL